MKNPKVSVIIPAYNCEEYIEQAILSCLCQDYENIEIVVVNDGSTDSTLEKIIPFADRGNVIVINQSNQGVSAARNVGIENASGDYVTFLDADDALGPGTISKNIDLLKKNPDVLWLYFPIQRVDMAGKEVESISDHLLPSFKYEAVSRLTSREAFSRMRDRQLPTCICGAFYHKDFLDRRFAPGRFEDTIMVMELLEKNTGLMVSPYGAYIYYDRPGSFINSAWTSDKWISYVSVRLQTMQTKQALFPGEIGSIEKERAQLYYNLCYLRSKYLEDNEFAKPLDYFNRQVGGRVRFSLRYWIEYKIKSVLVRCRKFGTKH